VCFLVFTAINIMFAIACLVGRVISGEDLEIGIDALLALRQPDIVPQPPQLHRQVLAAVLLFEEFLAQNQEDTAAALRRYEELMAQRRDLEEAAATGDEAAPDDVHRMERAMLSYNQWILENPQEELWQPQPWYRRPLRALRVAFGSLIFRLTRRRV
jgi:hypothetical protein